MADAFDRAFDAYRAAFDEGPPLMLARLPRDRWVAWMRHAIRRGRPLTVADLAPDLPPDAVI